jgi:hypothetical protein
MIKSGDGLAFEMKFDDVVDILGGGGDELLKFARIIRLWLCLHQNE